MKIKYSKETVLTRELFEIDETELTFVDQLSDHTDNKDSELVDMLQTYNASLEPKKTKPAKPKLSAVSTAIKLSSEHQKQQDELFKPDFTPNGDGKWDDALAYVKTEWESIKYCILNNKPLYIIGAVQLGKTIIYNAIAYLALTGFTKDDGTKESPLVELVLITTNNLTSSGDQNQIRSRQYLTNPTNSITVRDVTSIEATDTVLAGTVIHSLTNVSQLEKFNELVKRSAQSVKDHLEQIGGEFKPWTVLVLHDEADQTNPNIADNPTEQKSGKRFKNSGTEDELNQLLRMDPAVAEVRYIAISATLLSVLANYKKFGAHRYGDLQTEQIISVPIPKLYKGFVTSDSNGKIIWNPDFAKPGLSDVEDPQWCGSGGTYKPTAKAGNKKIHNPRFIAEKVVEYYKNNKYQALQIATVNLTKAIKGHKSLAELITGEMNLLNANSAEFIEDLTGSVNITKGYVVITHNGELDKVSAADKIGKICESAARNNIPLKGIIIIGGWLVSRAISFGNQKHTFAYCNISFTLQPNVIDKEAVIQSARCSGCYPDTKEHTFYTSTGCINTIKNYVDVVYNDFLPALRQQKVMTLPLVTDYITKLDRVYTNGTTKSVKTNSGNARHAATQNTSNGSTSRSSNTTFTNLTNAQRQDYINNGVLIGSSIKTVIAVDECLLLSKSEYDKLIIDTGNNDNQAVIDFLKSRQNDLGKIAIPSKFVRQSNDQKSTELKGNTQSTTIESYFKDARGPSVTVWQASNRSYWLYMWVGQPVGSSQLFATYNLEIDATGKVYHFDRPSQTSDIRRPALTLSPNGVILGELVI